MTLMMITERIREMCVLTRQAQNPRLGPNGSLGNFLLRGVNYNLEWDVGRCLVDSFLYKLTVLPTTYLST